jgi:hypothetical protein
VHFVARGVAINLSFGAISPNRETFLIGVLYFGVSVANPAPVDALFPTGFERPSSVFISGSSRTLLKWFAFAWLSPYGSRVYWTDVRLPGEILDPLDPMAMHAVPEESVYVLEPRELYPDEQGASRAEAAAATMLESDEAPDLIRGLVEFLRMPLHGQKLISATGRVDLPSILVTANSQRIAIAYSQDRLEPLMRAMLEAGTCQVALWAEAPTTLTSMFDATLALEGNDPADWRNATIRCERGITTGRLSGGRTVRLAEIESIATVLEKFLPAHPD